MAQTPRPVDAGIAVGEVLLGKYRVESILGHGGMGVVAKCVHLGLDKHVAIKMLRQDVLLDRDAVERFTREAQAASKLGSEHVAKVEDVGVFENGVPYMVMEFLDGHDLGQLVEEQGAINPQFASMLMLQAAEALSEAHARNIVHRDVKPSNLFVTWRPDGSALIKVLDFGISKSPAGTDMKLTQTQSLLGTPAYMSPEQMRSARLVDLRTDIWSLGTVFYELLEGRRPFEAESFSEMCVKVAVDPPSPMINAPQPLQAVILRCLAKNPDQRYANMAELARDLAPHVQDVHQASLLVERMTRIAGRRSAAGGDSMWESPTTGITRTPVPIRDIGSSPVIAPWHGGSEPLGAPVPTPSPFGRERTPDPRLPSATLREDGSGPAAAVSQVVAIPPTPKRKFPLIAVALLVVGAALGVMLALKLAGGDKPQEAASGTEIVHAPPIEATQPDKGSAKTEVKPVEDKPAAGKTEDKPATGKTDDKPAVDPEPDKKITKPVQRPTQRPTQRPVVVKQPPPPKCGKGEHLVDNKCIKDKEEAVAPVQPPPPKSKCKVIDLNPNEADVYMKTKQWPARCL